ncbi:DUF805 domain-containing protein [Candidatus Uhrbacteria bacterium]|nr:DUF805 domain-containing protein [Candidatus Uhrbacteria bacterium]
MNYYIDALKKYAVFSGRATRKEFWMFVLFNLIAMVILSIIDSFIGSGEMGILSGIYGLGVLLPSIGIAIRRLHDTNRSGWWLLIGLVPFIGAIVLIVFYAMPTVAGGAPAAPAAPAARPPQAPPAA